MGDEVPPLIRLPELAGLARQAETSDGAFERLAELTRLGSSLGGARPKVNVVDAEGRLSIAKFTSVQDDDSTIAWEYVALCLAERAGIDTPKSQLLRISGKPVLLMERFDRSAGSARIPYMSAMTMLQLADSHDAQSSYAEIADELPSQQGRHELFRRAALGLLISNADDHLRNHGLLRKNGVWGLSPAFDINPEIDRSMHATPLMFGEVDSVETLLGAAEYFELGSNQALRLLSDVVAAVHTWREEARRSGIAESEINRFAKIFESEHLEEAARATSTERSAE